MISVHQLSGFRKVDFGQLFRSLKGQKDRKTDRQTDRNDTNKDGGNEKRQTKKRRNGRNWNETEWCIRERAQAAPSEFQIAISFTTRYLNCTSPPLPPPPPPALHSDNYSTFQEDAMLAMNYWNSTPDGWFSELNSPSKQFHVPHQLFLAPLSFLFLADSLIDSLTRNT